MIEITRAEENDLEVIRSLFREYATSLDFNLCFQNFDQELATLPGAYSEPAGCILLARVAGKPAGCIALKPLASEICEMKRLYVRPEFQGQGIGRKLTLHVLDKGKAKGYRKMRLDTVKSMQAAIALYQSLGFYEIDAYYENPIAGATYLEKKLK